MAKVAEDEPEQVLHVGVIGAALGQVAEDEQRVVRQAAVVTELGEQQAERVVVGTLVQRTVDPRVRRLEVAASLAGPRQLA